MNSVSPTLLPIHVLFIDDPTRLSHDEAHVNELADDFRQRLREHPDEHPVQNPLRVVKQGEKYKIIVGANRWLAGLRVPLTQMPCVVLPHDLDAAGALIEQFRDNNLHQGYAPIEKANTLVTLMQLRKISQVKAAFILGIKESEATKLLKVMRNYPEDLHCRIGNGDGRIPFTTAYAFARLSPDVDKMRELTEKVIKGLLSRDDAEEMVNHLLGKQRDRRAKPVKIRAKNAVATLLGDARESAKALIAELNKWIKNVNSSP